MTTPKRRLFVAALPTRWDAATARRVPSLDLNPAATHGELVVMREGPVPDDALTGAIRTIGAAIAATFTPHDALVAVGDPLLFAAAAMAAHEQLDGAPLRVVRWDPATRAFMLGEVRL